MPASISTRAPGSLNPTRQQLDELDALLQRMLELPVNPLDAANEIEAEEDEPPSPPPVVRPPATKPPSYTVIETASPRPLPAASGFEPRPSPTTPRLTAATPPPESIDRVRPEPPAPVDPPTSAEETWVPLRSTWQPSAQTWQPLAESWRQAQEAPMPPAAVPSPVPSPQPDPTPPESAPQHIEESVASEPETAPPVEPTSSADAPLIEPRLSLTAEDAPEAEPRLLLPLLWFNQGFDACATQLGPVGRWLCGPNGRQTLGLAGLACLIAAVVVIVSTGMAWPW